MLLILFVLSVVIAIVCMRELQFSTTATKSKSREQAYSLALNQNKIDTQAVKCGVSLIQNFNSVINQEEQKQYLFQVVESHRQRLHVSKKSIIKIEID